MIMKQDKTYVFCYTERASMDIEVVASSEKEARKRMKEMYDNGYVDFSHLYTDKSRITLRRNKNV